MDAIDAYFTETVSANPHLRPRVGNPDEMRSNRLNRTLDLLKHRVTAPEAGIAEAVDGKVITALNEEAVVCAALGNKGGVNLVCSYEAFAVKMLGALRQDLIFARNRKLAGQAPYWLGIPILLTSHTWENGKNEQSHQDPTLCEAMMAEMTDVSRVLFPCDWNSAQASLRAVYESRGCIWSLVTPKRAQPHVFDATEAAALVRDGAVRLSGRGDESLILTATGAYQLSATLRASARLRERGIDHMVNYMLEPGRFRQPRDQMEAEALAPGDVRGTLYPPAARTRLFLTHCRADAFTGTIRPLDTGPDGTVVLGYANRGGTLDADGMMFANRCTWAHALDRIAPALGVAPETLLNAAELAAVRGTGDPAALL
jgi:phosphoketolase